VDVVNKFNDKIGYNSRSKTIERLIINYLKKTGANREDLPPICVNHSLPKRRNL